MGESKSVKELVCARKCVPALEGPSPWDFPSPALGRNSVCLSTCQVIIQVNYTGLRLFAGVKKVAEATGQAGFVFL